MISAKATVMPIGQMSPLLETLLQNPNFWIIIPIFIWLVLNIRLIHLRDWFEKKSQNRLDLLDAYLSKQEIADVETMEILRDFRDAQYFRFATGVSAKMPMRQALVKLHRRSSNTVSWRMIRRALPYLDVSRNGFAYVRKFTTLENIVYWYNQFTAYFCCLVAAVMLGYYVTAGALSFRSLLLSTANTVVVILLALFVFVQNFPMRAAKLIAATESENEERNEGY